LGQHDQAAEHAYHDQHRQQQYRLRTRMKRRSSITMEVGIPCLNEPARSI
jgi:hypothetical protein